MVKIIEIIALNPNWTIIFKKNSNFVAKCKELDIYSYGQTSEAAIQRLRQVISFYVQSVGEYIDKDTNDIKTNMTVKDQRYIN